VVFVRIAFAGMLFGIAELTSASVSVVFVRIELSGILFGIAELTSASVSVVFVRIVFSGILFGIAEPASEYVFTDGEAGAKLRTLEGVERLVGYMVIDRFDAIGCDSDVTLSGSRGSRDDVEGVGS
jgi:hypothetical protein